MKIDTAFQEDHQVKITVEVESEKFENAKRKSAKSIAKRVKIPGFRPGKAPYNIVLKHVGEASIIEEAIEIIIDEIYPDVIKESEINPYGPGTLENIESMDPPTFEFTVPLSPEVEIKEYKDIRIEYKEKEVSEKEINKVIDNLRDNQAVIEPTDRTALEGDMVYAVVSGEKKGEEDPEKKTIIEQRRFPILIEKKDADNTSEYPFPGFSRKLIGMAAEEETTLEYKFPKKYEHDESLQGVTGSYKVKIEEIKSRTLPELNDEFAKSVGDYDDLDALKEEIKKTLIERYAQESTFEYDNQILEKILENTEIKYPPQMLEEEIDRFVLDFNQQISQQGMNMDLYLKSQGMEMEELRDEFKPKAEERLKRGLVIYEISELEQISISDEEIQKKTEETLEEFSKFLSEEQMKSFTSGEGIQSIMNRIITDELTNRTLERLRMIAKGEEIPQEENESSDAVETETDDVKEEETPENEE